MDAAVLTSADDDVLRAATADIEALADRLEGPDGGWLKAVMPWPEPDQMRRGDRAHTR
jgi:hypothetical protein